MPILPKQDKEIQKGTKKLAEGITKGAEALKEQQETKHTPVVEAAIKMATEAVQMISDEREQEITAGIQKFTTVVPVAVVSTKPDPKASNWLAAAIQRNQAKVDDNANKHPLVLEAQPQRSMGK